MAERRTIPGDEGTSRVENRVDKNNPLFVRLASILLVLLCTFDGEEKGLGISAKAIGHFAGDLARVLVQDGSNVKARNEVWSRLPFFLLAAAAILGMFHDIEPTIFHNISIVEIALKGKE